MMVSLFDVIVAYREKHRHYHTWHHIMYMLDMAEKWGLEMDEELFLVIVFHDIEYDPLAKDNEEKSASLLESYFFDKYVLEGWFDAEQDDHFDGDDVHRAFPQLKEMIQAILDTKDHVARTELSKKLLDLDMSILGEDEEDYMWYLIRVFQEFFPGERLVGSTMGGVFFDDIGRDGEEKFPVNPLWIDGRSKWIKSTLAKENIFWTPDGKKLEERARHNLEQELKAYGQDA